MLATGRAAGHTLGGSAQLAIGEGHARSEIVALPLGGRVGLAAAGTRLAAPPPGTAARDTSPGTAAQKLAKVPPPAHARGVLPRR